MIHKPYRLEQMGDSNRWSILGDCESNGEAQAQMWELRRFFPRLALRVTDLRNMRIQVLHDPIVDRW